MQQSLWTSMEPIGDYILMRRPALPRKWDPVARPHVAILVDEPLTGQYARYYLSQIASLSSESSSEGIETVDLDKLASEVPVGTLLEVRFNAVRANLYRLERCGNVPCWRWIGKYRGIQSFDYPAPIDWDEMLYETRPNGTQATT